MRWKIILRNLEKNKQWDLAIDFMQKIIENNPSDPEPYMYIQFLLMNLLAEEDYEISHYERYAALLGSYFGVARTLFFDNPQYLFWTGITAVMGEWILKINVKDYEYMLQRAMELDPGNLIYQRTYYIHLDKNDASNRRQLIWYAQLWLTDNSEIMHTVKLWGSFGEYLVDCMQGWADRILTEKMSSV